jgi:hypothetical protein
MQGGPKTSNKVKPSNVTGHQYGGGAEGMATALKKATNGSQVKIE